MLPLAIGSALVLPFGGSLYDRIGARPLMLVGGALLTIACFLLAKVDIHTSGFDLVIPFGIFGMGVGLSLMPLNTQIMNAAPRNLVGRVSALSNAMTAVISALGVALLTTYLTTRPSYKGAVHIVAQAQMAAARAGHGAGHAATAAQSAPPAPIATLFSHAFADTFTLVGVIAVVATVLGLALRRRTEAQRIADSLGEHRVVQGADGW
jgi:MFS family permease